MASKTKKKASRTASKKAAKKGGPGGGGVSHTPIIITDGSTSVEFDEHEYPQPSSGSTHQSKKLRLIRVVATRKHNNGSLVCHELAADETVSVKFTCEIGGSTAGNDIVIRGGNFMDGSGSPSLTFDDQIYGKSLTPIEQGKRVGNDNAKLVRLEIFRGSTRVHDCEVITTDNIQIRARDRHLPKHNH